MKNSKYNGTSQQNFNHYKKQLESIEERLIPIVQGMLKEIYPKLLSMIPASVKKAYYPDPFYNIQKANNKVNGILSDAIREGLNLGQAGLYRKFVQRGISSKKIDMVFNEDQAFHSAFKALQERSRMTFEDAQDTLQEDARLYIKDALERGIVYNEIADGLKDILGYDEPWRAERIARTEANWAANQGIKSAGDNLNITKYTVNVSPDACDVCVSTVGNNNSFDSEEINTILPVHPNCRCTADPVIPDDWQLEDYL